MEKCANVTEGLCYPVGYHLLFSGTGYLNGEVINQNTAISKIGENILELEGINETYQIKFTSVVSDVWLDEELNYDYDYSSFDEKNISTPFEAGLITANDIKDQIENERNNCRNQQKQAGNRTTAILK